MNAVDHYVHYSFSNAGIEVVNFATQKQEALEETLNTFIRRNNDRYNNPNKDARDMLEIYNELSEGKILGGKLSEELQKTMNQSTTSDSSAGGKDGASFQQIALMAPDMLKKKHSDGFALAQKLCDQLGDIIGEQQKLLDDLDKTLRENYPKARDWALKEIADRGSSSPSTQKAAREIVQDALHKNEFWIQPTENIDGSGKKLADSYLRLWQRLNALEILQGDNPSVAKTNYTTTMKGKFAAELIGKMGGTWSNVGGELSEVAVDAAAGALLEGNKELFQNLPNEIIFGHAITGSSGLTVESKAKLDPRLQKIVSSAESSKGTFNKNDVTIFYSKDGVLATYGISVKTSNASSKTKNGRAPIKIHQPTLAALLRLVRTKDDNPLSEYQVYNLAAGNNKKDDPEFADEDVKGLDAMWRSYIDYAVARCFVDLLAGDNSLYSNSALLVANGEVYKMEEIFGAIPNSPKALSLTANGAKRTGRFKYLNTWSDAIKEYRSKEAEEANIRIRSTREGQARSKKLVADLNSAFSKIQMQVKLDIGMLNLRKL